MKTTNQFNLPDVVVSALTRDTYDPGDTTFSVTQLIDSPRIGILQQGHDSAIERDVVDFLWSRFGTSMHNMFEDAVEGDQYITEERLFYETQGCKISGAIDLQEKTPEGLIIRDYKVTSAWSVIYGKSEWETQLNAYEWLVRHVMYVRVAAVEIVAILRDWNRRSAETKADYPQSPIQIIRISRWTEAEQDAYMDERIRLHTEAEKSFFMGDPLPLCSDEERWMKPTKYALKKGKNIRALKIFDTMEAAQQSLETKDDSHHIQERPGEYTRCEQDWCRVSQWCDQFRGKE